MRVMLLLVPAVGALKLLGKLGLVSGRRWWLLFRGRVASRGRVLTSTVLATLWTLPVGLWVGMSPTWSRHLQPIAKVVASFPMSNTRSVSGPATKGWIV